MTLEPFDHRFAHQDAGDLQADAEEDPAGYQSVEPTVDIFSKNAGSGHGTEDGAQRSRPAKEENTDFGAEFIEDHAADDDGAEHIQPGGGTDDNAEIGVAEAPGFTHHVLQR